MIQEVVILRTVFLMTVDEAFYEPLKKRTDMRKGNFHSMQNVVIKAYPEITFTKYQSGTCELTQQPVDAF